MGVAYLIAETASTKLPDLPTPWGGISGELMQALLLLLPGLLTVAIVQSLTVRQRLEPLERIIQALLYTFVNHVTWQVFLLAFNVLLFAVTWGHGWWQPSPMWYLIGLGGCAFLWGLFVTWIINVGWLHDKLREPGWFNNCLKVVRVGPLCHILPEEIEFGLTKRSSRPSEWYDAFYDADDLFVVVHLKDRRRIYGWARLYPDLPTEGHLMICDAEWLDDAVDAPKRPLVRILLNVQDVQFIEFVNPLPENQDAGTKTATGNSVDSEEGRGES